MHLRMRAAEGPIHTHPAGRFSVGLVGSPGRTLLPLAALPGDVRLLLSSGLLPVTRLPARPRLLVTAVPSGGRGTDARQAKGKSAGSRVAQPVPEWLPLPPPAPAASERMASGVRSAPDAHRPAPAEVALLTEEQMETMGTVPRSRSRDPGHAEPRRRREVGGRVCDGDAVLGSGERERAGLVARRGNGSRFYLLFPGTGSLVDGDGVGAGTGVSPRGQAVSRNRGLQPDFLRERAP